MCYSSAFCCGGVLGAVSSCRTPFRLRTFQISLRCTPSTGTYFCGVFLPHVSCKRTFLDVLHVIKSSTSFFLVGGHISVHSFIRLFIICLTVRMVQPCPLVVTFLFAGVQYFTPISVSIATFRPLLPFTRSTGFTTGN